MSAYRLYIASIEADEVERALCCDPAFFIVGSGSDGSALDEILGLCPDAVVMDCVLSGADGQEMLRQIGETMPAPPRALLLRRTDMPVLPADGVCDYPCSGGALRQDALAAAEQPLPMLARDCALVRLGFAQRYARRLGVDEKLKGFQYVTHGAAALCCAPQLGESMKQGLYPYLAHQFGVTPASVEKAVRTAIESTWLKGSLEEIQALFGLTVDPERGKPTNGECLTLLAEHVRRDMKKYLMDQKR
jgi:two-component system response regulator (stage 0 sporulation protein A)